MTDGAFFDKLDKEKMTDGLHPVYSFIPTLHHSSRERGGDLNLYRRQWNSQLRVNFAFAYERPMEDESRCLSERVDGWGELWREDRVGCWGKTIRWSRRGW